MQGYVWNGLGDRSKNMPSETQFDPQGALQGGLKSSQLKNIDNYGDDWSPLWATWGSG